MQNRCKKFYVFNNQSDKLKGDIMAKSKEIWVRFSDTETYSEKESAFIRMTTTNNTTAVA